jgi:hypothetical protein
VVFTDFFNEKTVKTYKRNRLLGRGRLRGGRAFLAVGYGGLAGFADLDLRAA